MKAIYTPGGRAYEYAERALTLYTGCTNGCIYCFGPTIFSTTPTDFHANATPRAGILSALRKECTELSSDLFGNKPPNILLSFASDPYPKNHVITRPAIYILRQNGIPFTLLTKRPTHALSDLDLFGPGCTLATTLAAPRDTWKTLEPRADPPEDRITALRIAHADRHPTWISLEPCIDPDWTMDMIRSTADCCDHYRLGPINYHQNPIHRRVIHWPTVLPRIITLCESLHRPIWIKKDLHQYLTREQLCHLTPPSHLNWTA